MTRVVDPLTKQFAGAYQAFPWSSAGRPGKYPRASEAACRDYHGNYDGGCYIHIGRIVAPANRKLGRPEQKATDVNSTRTVSADWDEATRAYSIAPPIQILVNTRVYAFKS